MKRLKKLTAGLLGAALCLSCAACTSVAENTGIYFSTTSGILQNLFNSGKIPEKTAPVQGGSSGQPLAAPTEFTIDADGNYSFTGVEGAQYYLLYFCAPDATSDQDSFIYSSNQIPSTGAGSYSGRCADEFSYAFGEYLAKVFAFPDLTDSEHAMSTAATASYTCTGSQSAPELSYYWNTFAGTMGVQVANMGVYEFQAYPDKVDVTFTNTEDSSDVVTVTIDGVSPANCAAVTDGLTRGATYSVSAVATSSNPLVLNPTSDTTVVTDGVTLGDCHVYVGSYSYSDGFANNIFNWPIVAENFDLAGGGDAGLAAGMRGMTMFTADPADTASGSAHSYTIHGGNWAQGPLELLPDGTFTAHETGGGPVNASTIQGTWVDHGDGTATLNYDHSTIVIE